MIDRMYFKKYLDSLAFLEGEEGVQEGLVAKLGGAPIPIYQEDILKEISRQKTNEELDYKSILKAIVAIYALDPGFPFWENYSQVLGELDQEAIKYLNQKRGEALKEENLDWAYIYGKSLYSLTKENKELYFLTLIMEGIYNRDWIKKQEEEGETEYLKEILLAIEENYNEILKTDPDNSLVLERLGNLYISREQYVKARLYLEKALQGNGKEEDLQVARERLLEIENQAFLEAADSYMAYNRFEEALKQLEQIKEKSFLPNLVNHKKGLAYYGLSRYDLAKDFLTQALVYDSGNCEILNDLAVAQVGTGDLEEAISTLNRAIKVEPNSRSSIYNRAIILYKLGRDQEALRDFKQAYLLESDPNLLEIIGNIEGKRKM